MKKGFFLLITLLLVFVQFSSNASAKESGFPQLESAQFINFEIVKLDSVLYFTGEIVPKFGFYQFSLIEFEPVEIEKPPNESPNFNYLAHLHNTYRRT